MQSLQEKFQVILGPVSDEDPGPWVAPSHKHYPNLPVECLPPTAIYEPVVAQHGMKLVTAGATDVTDEVNPWVFKQGFNRHKMGPTDDMYTGEHADHFYSDAGGFVERNNYLDRE